MSLRLLQRGQLLVAGVVLIVIVALMISALGFLYVSNQSSSALHNSSAAAYYAARSGIEVATRQFANGTACAALAVGPPGLPPPVGTDASFSTVATSYNVSPPTVNNTTVNATQTFIPIGAGVIGNYAPSGRVRIQTEEIDYSAQSTDSATCGGTPPCLVVSERGAAGTTAAAHAAQPVYQNLCHIRSTGVSGRATRIVERSLHDAAAMMVYAKVGSGVAAADFPRPFYRFWTGVAWGAEQTNAGNFGLSGAGAEISWMKLKMARTRNEAILATVHNDGSIRLQIWDGFRWFVPAALGAGGQLVAAGVLGGDTAFRGVDVAYETSSDHAIIVYNNATRNPQFRIWDGSTLLAQTGVNTSLGVANYPTSGTPRWIRLASNPLAASNEITMITLDSNQAVTGVRWTGTAFASLEVGAATVWDANASDANTREAIAVEHEQNSGRAMFMWATNAAPNIRYRIWNNTVPPISAINTLAIATMAGRGQWLRLVAQSNSNDLLFGEQDSGRDLSTRLWNGSAWDTQTEHPEHDASVQQATSRTFDLVFETHPSQTGKAWLVLANGAGEVAPRCTTGNVVCMRKFTPCSGVSCWAASTSEPGSDRTSGVEMLTHPQSGAVFALAYETSGATNRRIVEQRLTGGAGAWSGLTQIWAGPNDTNTNTEGRHQLAARRHINVITQEFFPP